MALPDFTTQSAAAYKANIDAAFFAQGTLQLFQQSTAPVGWTKETTHNNKALRVVSGTVGSGGATAFTTVFGAGKVVGGTAITAAQMANHTHTASSANESAHTHGESSHVTGGGTTVVSEGVPVAVINSLFAATSDVTGAGSAHNHAITVNATTGGGSTHNHTLSLDLQYVDLIIASRDA